MTERTYELSEHVDLTLFYGVNNANLRLLTALLGNVKLSARGVSLRLQGTDEAVTQALRAVSRLENHLLDRNTLTEEAIIRLLKDGTTADRAAEKVIVYGSNGRPITARTPNQQRFVEAFDRHDLLFAIGPAGSGKTFCAIALAVRALKNRQVRRIILSRPAVEAGERLGFLPGDMREKVEPYLQPLYDALQEMVTAAKLKDYIERGVISIAPLAFMRGRTISDAVAVLDESQNTTPEQMKMFLTRMGPSSKIIVTGDLTQVDLAPRQTSGLAHALARLDKIHGIKRIDFDEKDILRHPLVKQIVKAYETETNNQTTKI